MSSFVTIPVETDPDALVSEILDLLETNIPGIEIAEGSPEMFLIRALAQRIGAPVAEVLADVPTEAFRQFGATVHGVAELAATSATGETTWTMVDNAGYEIAAGTQVSIPTSGDSAVGFQVLNTVVVPPGSTATAAGEVVISAILPGSTANGLTGDPDLVDSLAFVSAITQTTAETSGGVDAETGDEYLDRLRNTLQTLSTGVVLPRDAEILAMSVPGVARALALDGYDAVAETDGNDRTITVAVVDEDGADLSSPVMDEVEALLEARREVNFVVYVIGATRTQIKVSATVKALPGFDAAGVEAACEQALTDYLDDATWGWPNPNEDKPGNWRQDEVVRRFELVSVLDRVDSVDYVSAVTLAKQADALGTADISLDTPAALATVGTLAITVT